MILLDIQDKLNELSSKLSSLTQEQLKEWSDQALNDSKKPIPVMMNRSGRMLPPGEYDRPIDKYLDETWGKDFFR
jgi:hypothetical protein